MATTTTAGTPLYVARDNLLGVDVCAPSPRLEAGEAATAASIAAGNRGERVALADGTDRFTVRTAPPVEVFTVTATGPELAAIRSSVCKSAPISKAPNMATLCAVIDAARPVGGETYSPLQAEAMLCLWEEMLDRQREAAHARPEDITPAQSVLLQVWEDEGSVAMRHHAKDLAAFALAVYDAIPDNLTDGHAYDWEVIPAILDRVQWRALEDSNVYGIAAYDLPDPAEAARAVVAALGETWPEPEEA